MSDDYAFAVIVSPMAPAFCPNCGAELELYDDHCMRCYQKIRWEDEEDEV